MLEEELKSLSSVRIEHAKDCLEESKILLNSHQYKGSVNRSYYAAFHAMRAVLILDGFDSKKHSGIISKFRELYVKTDLFDKEMSNNISSLFRIRQSGDYDDFYLISANEAELQLEKAEKIVKDIAAF